MKKTLVTGMPTTINCVSNVEIIEVKGIFYHWNEMKVTLQRHSVPLNGGGGIAMLVREQTNQYDHNAIAVMIYGSTLVGYLSKGDAAVYAPIMDRKKIYLECRFQLIKVAGQPPVKMFVVLPSPVSLKKV